MDKTRIAIAGEFAVLSQLALNGYDANLTLGNTKSVDILVSNPNGEMYRLEVKTNVSEVQNSKKYGSNFKWMMQAKHENIKDEKLFYCFVNMNIDGTKSRFFIVPSLVVATYVQNDHKKYMEYGEEHGLKRNDNPMRWFRIKLDEDSCNFSSPLSKKYENNWNFKF